ncbi:hypothetical protein SADUNF_Sadunf19G0100500 [Salix dunnii]|uniref:Uncharacterized protein n=1 Tax=Salix dunnii TaxID=1413687 RepID=A0A835MD09_9ROSI|nr:hypothetical protein SADUNF_Sadunf19G0100500 [Salix dunnii]
MKDFKCFFEGVCSPLLDLESRHFHGQQETGKQPQWLAYIAFIFRCSKPVLHDVAKHESQSSKIEVQKPSTESMTPLNLKVELLGA